jgi:hypothetical protein
MTNKHPKRPGDPTNSPEAIIGIAAGEVEDREPTPEERGKKRLGNNQTDPLPARAIARRCGCD